MYVIFRSLLPEHSYCQLSYLSCKSHPMNPWVFSWTKSLLNLAVRKTLVQAAFLSVLDYQETCTLTELTYII